MVLTIEKAKKLMERNKGNLNLARSDITSLPDGLTVPGNLNLAYTKIASLPDGLTVGGSLYLCYTQITTLPDDLTVGSALYLDNTPITALPNGLTVGGSLDLRGTPITTLPDGLVVCGNLYLSHTPITTLPDGLTVGGWLDLRSTPIAKEAGVSRATLYNNPKLKERIMGLRALALNPLSEEDAEPKKTKVQRLEDTVADLRARVRQLETDKKNLIVQLVDYEETKDENERLRRQLMKGAAHEE